MTRTLQDAAVACLATAALFFIVPAGMVLFMPSMMASEESKPIFWAWLDISAGMDSDNAPASPSIGGSVTTPPLEVENVPLVDVQLDALPFVSVPLFTLSHLESGMISGGAGGGVLKAGAYPLTPLNPTYPSAARSRGIEGIVVVEFSVDATGRTRDSVVVEAEPEGVFEDTVLRAVRQWRFSPALHEDGHTVAVRFRQVVRFSLK